MSDAGFLSRWSRRKTAARAGEDVAPEPVAVPVAPADIPPQPADAASLPQAPALTLADVALLRPGDEISRFVARGVDESVKRAALKTLFADPHFNVMDGLDTYIDDYGKPDPIPLDVLRRLTQSESLGLFDPVEASEETVEAVTGPALPAPAAGPVAPARAQDVVSHQEPEALPAPAGPTPENNA
jgi:hypothetical protein